MSINLMKRTVLSVLVVFLVLAQFHDGIVAETNEKPASIDVNYDEPGYLDANASIDESKQKLEDNVASGKYWSKDQINLSVYQSVGIRHKSTEDRYDVQRDVFGNSYFGVYDGHGGAVTSSMLQQEAIKNYIVPVIRAFNEPLNDKKIELNYEELKRNLKIAVMKLDERALKLSMDGSTLNIVVNTSEYLIAINVGDSRSVMLDPFSQTFQLTQDHKPDSPYERERIVRYMSHVTRRKYKASYVSRVGPLALSRSVGDVGCKLLPNVVTSEPDVFIYAKNNNRQYNNAAMILLATDGIWDGIGNEQATGLILRNYCKRDGTIANLINMLLGDDDQSKYLNKAVTQLGQEARKRSTDDITVVAAILDKKICNYQLD